MDSTRAGSADDLLARVPPDDRPALGTLLASTGPAFETDLHLSGLNGPGTQAEPRWFRLSGEWQEAAGSLAAHWRISAVDIHDLKEAQTQRDVLQALTDASPNCIKVLDLGAHLLSMNEGGQATMEIDDFEVCRGLLWPTFWQGEARAQVEAALERARQGERTTFEAQTATWKGTPRWWEVTVGPLYDTRGQLRHLSAVSRDITSRREAQDAVTALDAFVAFTEAAGAITDVQVLAGAALQVLRATLGEVSAAYHTLEGDLWKAQVWTDDFSPEVVARLTAGIPVSSPSFAEVRRSGEVVFVDGWEAEQEGLAETRSYGAAAFSPSFVGQSVGSLLTMGTRRRAWTAREQAVFRAVGRSLTLALERAEATRLLGEHRLELQARTRALEGFAALTHDLTLQSDPLALVRQAMEMVLSLLPPGYANFWQLRGDTWQATTQVGTVGSAELQTAIDAGFPAGQVLSLDRPLQTREPWFQDVYNPQQDIDPALVAHLGTVATLPVLVNGVVLGIFCVPLFDQRSWGTADRVVLTTTVRSLGLALEGAQGVAALAEERRKLEAANEELEAFAYSVSHDLRTPVRHILGFHALLRRGLAEHLDEKSGRYLDVIEEAAQRMNTLIDAMLELSRTSRLPLRSRLVDLGAVVDGVIQTLRPDLNGREVQWKIGPLPMVQGDPDTLQQVIENLLSNALKYSREREVSVIEVGAEEHEAEWAVWVRDNGAGFDPRYQDKLFGVFQRLHRHDEFEGVGVGLANVRRIVHRHGGQVQASGQVDHGATFRFTLPK
ncbi:histidine kinase [Deinococcus koreensis]|uniref:histidine kinase n=1 Tax=Deinococcus koreensis TaxID=2054903 RepID=A0A2K3USR7_9DEIO|nr:histidine kinase [Deinococcus koreensis]